MPKLSTLIGLCIGAALLSGCPKKTSTDSAPSGPAPSEPHHGAWYGSGMAFPGERLCVVFCPDGKMFAGDARCEDVYHEKFSRPWLYTLEGILVSAKNDGTEIAFEWRQTGTHAVADIAGITNLPLDQQSMTSPLCGNAPMPEKPPPKVPDVPF